MLELWGDNAKGQEKILALLQTSIIELKDPQAIKKLQSFSSREKFNSSIMNTFFSVTESLIKEQ